MNIEIPVYANKSELFEWLLENKSLHIDAKKMETKQADSIHCAIEKDASKAATPIDISTTDTIKVESIINTTKVMDSHQDVHIDGLWNKSLRQDKDLMLLQEHQMKFDHVISDQVKASAQIRTWKELGFKFKGETQALVFNSTIQKARNEYMFKQYAQGFVKNHSVGMRYIKLSLAINNDSEDFKEEFDTYNKYINDIINRKAVEDQGFFWAVKEARVLEGSAVVKGSNPLTPTSSMEAKSEQSKDTPEHEQSDDTQSTMKHFFNF